MLATVNDDNEPDSQEMQDVLLEHVVFPRFLPNQKPRYFHELELMIRLVQTVEDLTQWIPPKTVDLLEKMRRVHLECTPNVVSEEINTLCPGNLKSLKSKLHEIFHMNKMISAGDTFAMFVRRQNCAILVHMPPEEMVEAEESQNVIVATFPANLHPGESYKYDSDLEVISV